MRARRFAYMAALLLAGCAGHHMEEEGHHEVVPYTCPGGKQALVAYEGGGYFPRARAKVTYDGRETEMRAVPPTYGLRYVSEGAEGGEGGEAHGGGEGGHGAAERHEGGGSHGAAEGHAGGEAHGAGEGQAGGGENAPILIWSVRGEDAWLSQLDPGQTEEREIAHCMRLREGSAEAGEAAEAH